jgi:Uncharacterized conserved protein (COG2071)
MMSTVRGTIRRRILVNFRVDPDVAQRQLPCGFLPKLSAGYAVAGVCLIRLEKERPSRVPAWIGLSSENAAHRFGAYRIDGDLREDCVYIARRHSGSLANIVLGGRIFPGEHHAARFSVRDEAGGIDLTMAAPDGFAVQVRARRARVMPTGSVFASVAEASRYFRGGSVGYSETHSGMSLDGLELRATRWDIAPLDVSFVRSSYFDDRERFPRGTIEFDSALLMTDIDHEWRRAENIRHATRICA